MSITIFEAVATVESLMRKSKHDLAVLVLALLDKAETVTTKGRCMRCERPATAVYLCERHYEELVA